jgi:hypothetical protein
MGREVEGRAGKGREGKGREGKGREGKERKVPNFNAGVARQQLQSKVGASRHFGVFELVAGKWCRAALAHELLQLPFRQQVQVFVVDAWRMDLQPPVDVGRVNARVDDPHQQLEHVRSLRQAAICGGRQTQHKMELRHHVYITR